MLKFELIKQNNYQDDKSRLGKIRTAHGGINTPTFMPVGTCASVKGITPAQLDDIGAEIILSNAYHLMLRPGAKLINSLGGLHKFMHWHKPILTDSGGFQVMSLSALRKVTEQGVEFRSHIDGSLHLLTPEKSTQIQHLVGSTISMIFDECLQLPATYEQTRNSMELSLRWAERSKNSFVKRDGYGQFAIVQGGMFEVLRIQSAKSLIEMSFDGYAIGGLAVGETQSQMFEVLDYTAPILPKEKPRYLMGVGKPSDIIGAVKRGVDMFDCVIPTRSGRNGQAFTKNGPINIRNQQYKTNTAPLEEGCECYCCKNFNKAYIHHLVKAKEMLGAILMTLHNLHYFQDLMKRIRAYINDGREIDFDA